MTQGPRTPEEAHEVRRLLGVYQDATSRAAAALGRYSTDSTAPATALEADQRAGEALRRIRKIYGDVD